jgi:hypothetical protein
MLGEIRKGFNNAVAQLLFQSPSSSNIEMTQTIFFPYLRSRIGTEY